MSCVVLFREIVSRICNLRQIESMLTPIMMRLTTDRARSMLGRLAGLRSAARQRALGWPNLKLGTAGLRRKAALRRQRQLAQLDPLADPHPLSENVTDPHLTSRDKKFF